MAILIPFDFLLFDEGVFFARLRIASIILFTLNIAFFNYTESKKETPELRKVDFFFLLPPLTFCLLYIYFLFSVNSMEFGIVLIATYLVIFFTTFLIHQFWIEQYVLNISTLAGLLTVMILRQEVQTDITMAIIVLICSAIVSVFFRREFVGNMYLRKNTQDLLLAVDHVESSNKMKNDFLNNMSHELRTPLNAIFGYTDILKMSLGDRINDEEKEYLNAIIKGKDKILDLVNQMLDLSRVETGSSVLEIVDIKPDEVVKPIIQSMKPTIARKELSIVESYTDAGALIKVDVKRFTLVVRHLLENAVKFTEKGGITVKSYISDDQYNLSVLDTGIGIKKDFLPYLFIPFRQAEEGISRSYEGAGIGLPLVKHYTNEMDGNLVFNSMEGEGSKFTISFTLVSEPEKK